MSSNSEILQGAAVAAHSIRKTYSRRRWNAFDAWQDHIRKSAATVGVAFSERHDRDLRRAIVTG